MMALTGKCKEDFEKWYIHTNQNYDSLAVIDKGKLNMFYRLKYSMQYGVYVDFYESVGIIIDIQPLLDYNHKSYTKVYSFFVSVNQLNVEQPTE